MIKKILRLFTVNIAILYFLPQIVSSVLYLEGAKTILFTAGVLAIANIFARPLVKLVMLPVNILSLGMLSWLSNVFILYLTLYIVPGFIISPFSFVGLEYQGFTIPAWDFSYFWTIVLVSFLISSVYSVISWIFDI